MLKEYINQYKHDKEILIWKKRHDIDDLGLETSYKNLFTNKFTVDIFVFIMAIILVIKIMIIIYALCKHNN